MEGRMWGHREGDPGSTASSPIYPKRRWSASNNAGFKDGHPKPIFPSRNHSMEKSHV
jgi:hypothetical protein